MRTRIPLIPAGVATLLLLCGCGGVLPPGQNAAAPDSQSVDPFLPFSALQRVSEDDAKTRTDATERLVARCMKSKGFTYIPVPYQKSTEDRLPWADVEWSRQHGYGFLFSDQPAGGGADDPNAQIDLPAEQKKAWMAALQGNGDDMVNVELGDSTTSFSKSSCRTVANEQIDGDLVAAVKTRRTFEDIANEVTRRVDADPRIAASYKSWSECMQKAGYSFATPDQATTSVSSRVLSGELSAEQGRSQEVAVAVADAGCAQQADLLGVRRGVAKEVESQVRSQHENDILRFTELQAASVAKATALMSST